MLVLADGVLDVAQAVLDLALDVLVRHQTVRRAPRPMTSRATKMTTTAPNTATARLVEVEAGDVGDAEHGPRR